MVPASGPKLSTPPAQTHLLLSEFLTLRALVLAFHTEILNGNKITEQRITAMIQQVEANKFALAENRIPASNRSRKPTPETRRNREQSGWPLRLLHPPIPLRLSRVKATLRAAAPASTRAGYAKNLSIKRRSGAAR